MLQLGSTYFQVRDMKRSIEFYKALLQVEPVSGNLERWAEFHFGSCIALYNREYDLHMIRENKDLHAHYNADYLDYVQNCPIRYGNSAVLNFYVPDLRQEYERVKALNTGKITPIYYINVVMPYYCFMLEDPDGNLIEITGGWEPDERDC